MRMMRCLATPAMGLGFGLAVCLAPFAGGVIAQEATPTAAPLPQGCVVLADGLVNPRYVAVGDDGTVYVTEAGLGGDESIPPMGGEAPPIVEGPATDHRGPSGRVVSFAPDGTQSIVADGLASYVFNGIEAIGPAGIAFADGKLIVAVGGSGPLAGVLDPIAHENQVLSIVPATGEITALADIGEIERAENPDGFAIDSNLYGVAVDADGTIWVNDAGGNATYRIPAGGEAELVAVHPGLTAEGFAFPPEGNPSREGAVELDPVPTGLTVMDDGTVVSGLLSGGPFPPGAARAVSIGDDGTLSDRLTGLTMNVGVATGPDGALYASQLSTDFAGEMPAPGNVVRMVEDGTFEMVVDGLTLPNGIAFDADGHLLVVNNTLGFGAATGQVLRCELPESAGQDDELVVVEIDLMDVFFEPDEITIPADTDVTIRITNGGFVPHNLSITAAGIISPLLQNGETWETTVNLPAGDYGIVCTVIGHRQAGMTGVIHVID